MASKMDKWKAISVGGTSNSTGGVDDNRKSDLVGDLSRVPNMNTSVDEEDKNKEINIISTDGVDSESGSINPTDNVGVEKESINSTDNVEVESVNENYTDEEEVGNQVLESDSNADSDGNPDGTQDAPHIQEQQQSKQTKTETEAPKVPKKQKTDSLISKVNNIVKHNIETKQTKEDTHEKTSIQLELTVLAKLELFDRAHGGRIKGDFIQNLLEQYFADCEKENPAWKKIFSEQEVGRLVEGYKAKKRSKKSGFNPLS